MAAPSDSFGNEDFINAVLGGEVVKQYAAIRLGGESSQEAFNRAIVPHFGATGGHIDAPLINEACLKLEHSVPFKAAIQELQAEKAEEEPAK